MENEKKKYTADDLLKLPDDFTEKMIIKQLLKPENTDSSYFIAQNFKDKWFKNEISGKLFKVLKTYWEKYQAFPPREFLYQCFRNDKLKDNESQLKRLSEEIYCIKESEYDRMYLQDMIVRFTKERALYFTLLENIDTIEKHGDVSCCFEKFEEISKYDLNTDLGIEYFSNIDKHCMQLQEKDVKVPFSYKMFDYVTYGGLPAHDTCLCLFMAKPGLGKSMFMTNIAVNWLLQNKKVLIISLEMSEHMYSMRIDSILSEININELSGATESLKRQIKALKMSIPDALLQIKEFPTGTCNTMMIKQYCKKLKETKGFIPDLIVVDYLNIMRANSSQANDALYQKGKSIAEELRAMSGEYKIPIMSAVQSNRSNSNGSKFAEKSIDMENTAESSGIPATTDVFFSFYQLDGERDDNKIHVKVIKNRLGGFVGSDFLMYVNYKNLKVNDWPEDTLNMPEENDSSVEAKMKQDSDDIKMAIDCL